MDTRLPYNSKSLQQQFPDVYRDFFSRCQLVVSTSHLFAWAGGTAVGRDGSLALRECLPTRTYVGVTRTADHRMRIVSDIAYNEHTQQFHANDLDAMFRQRVERDFPLFMMHAMGVREQMGFEIVVLAERNGTYGSGYSGALLSSLCAATALYLDRLSSDDVRSWSAMRCEELLRPESPFMCHFGAMWRWSQWVYPQSAGTYIATAVLPSFSPIISTLTSPLPGRRSTDLRPDVSDIRTAYHLPPPIRCIRTHELDDAMPVGPLDSIEYGILYVPGDRSGQEFRMIAEERAAQYAQHARRATQYIEALLRGITASEADSVPVAHLAKLAQDPLYCLRASLEPIRILSFGMIDAWIALRRDGFSTDRAEQLFATMHAITRMFQALGAMTPKCEVMVSSLQRAFDRAAGLHRYGIQLNSHSRGTNILIAAPHPTLRAVFDDVLDDIEASMGDRAHVVHQSWVDGVAGEGGLRIEQDTRHGMYSPLLGSDVLVCTQHTARGERVERFVPRHDPSCVGADVQCNLVTEELFVGGQPVTSEEIPSQRVTNILLAALLDAPAHVVRNTDLPESSYARYRNELQGKIVGPLTRLVRERCGKDLGLTISGTLTKFSISLDPTGLDIAVIRPRA